MSFALVILEPHGQRAERGQAGGEAAYAAMLAFADGLRERGQLVLAQALATAQQRHLDGHWTDGPFTEAKEFLGGIFLLQNVTRAEAQAIATACPAAAWATVELRELGPCFT